jgi:hypothetical protein
MSNEAPKLVHEGGSPESSFPSLDVMDKLIQEKMVHPLNATDEDIKAAEWGIERRTDGQWVPAYYAKPGIDAEFSAGKVAQLTNRLGGEMRVVKYKKV